MKGGWALLLGCLLGLLPAPASEPPPLDSYRVRIFTEDHGLVTNNLTALAQTPDGYLWLGSYGGLARFDGVRFTMFTRENTPILPSNTIRSLFTDREGTLWIGAAGGLLRYDARGFQRVPLPEESPSERVLAIAQDSGGVLWFGTRNGVVVQDGGHLRRLAPEGPPLIVNALATTPGGQVWVGGDRGLFQVEGRGLRARTFPGLPPGEPINALALAPDGTLWAGTGRGLLQVDARGSHLITLRDGLPLPTVDRLFLEASGALWIASLNGGVARFWKGRFAFPPTPTLRIDHFEDMLADAEGSLWLPTYASGLVQLSSREVRSRGFRDGLLSEQIRCVVEDRRGSLWMGTNSQGLIEKRGDAYTVIGRKEGLGHPTVATLAEAPDGSLWAGTYLGGVYRVAQGRAHPVPELALTRKGSVRALLKDRLDRMWIGVDENLLLWDKGHVSRVGRGIGSPSAIYTLAEDREGTIWAGTFDGALLRIRQSQMEVLGPEIGLPGTAIFHLFPDPEGGIWIATFGGGLRWLREGRLMEVGLDRGLPPSQIFSLVLDPTGNLWGRTQDGLFTVPMKALRGAALGQPGPLPVRLLGRLDDVGASSGPSLSGAVLDRGGNLFFESVRGLVVRSPAPFPPEPPVPKVLVEHFRADGVDLPSGAEPLWGGGNLEFEYTAPSFLLPDKVQFRYQLEGFDPAWVEAGTRRKAFYTNVPPGTYTFRVRASNEAGVWNEGGATATFRLRPRFYQALWFTGLWIAAGLALLWLTLRWRIRGLREAQALLQATVEARTWDLQATAISLGTKNAELEEFDRMVKALNREMGLGPLLRVLLELVAAQFPAAQRAVFLLRDDESGVFRTAGHHGYPPTDVPLAEAFQVPEDNILAWYEQHKGGVKGGVYLVQDLAGLPGADRMKLSPPKSLLLMPIEIDGRLEGFLSLNNLEDPDAFEEADGAKLLRFREHLLSALTKARTLAQLAEAKERAEAATRSKSDFLANMSHEIRTPMNAILGFAGLGLKQDFPPKAREYFQKIASSGKSLLGIINDILDFSKIEAGKLELERVPFDLPELLSSTSDLFAHMAMNKGLELIVSAGVHVPRTLEGDPLRLGQVLVNLTGNALKFTESGQVHLRVDLLEKTDGQAHLHFAVSDSGIGISPEDQPRVFSAFSQADTSNTRRFGGTGLGLSISKRLVEMMGGEIFVQSEFGAGSTFSFSLHLPFDPAQPDAVRQAPGDLVGMKVLVVDDNEIARTVLVEQLRAFGFEPTAASSAQAALEALGSASTPFGLVILDWKMPEMDGVEALRQIRGCTDPAPRVVLATAFGQEELRAQARDLDIAGFLPKPLSSSRLLDGLLEALEREGSAPLPILPRSAPLNRGHLRGARVLLVEDNPINQQVASEILAGEGILVQVADSGFQAVQAVGHGTFDAVLMDIQMPGMDGYEATARIRERTQNLDLPIIAMTAHALQGYREECLAAGMNDYLTKPVDPDVLFRVLRKWVAPREVLPLAAPPPPPAPPSPAPSLEAPGFDVPAALRRMGGKESLFLRLVGDFAGDNADAGTQIRSALRAGNHPLAERLVHTLKGVAGNLGATPLQTAAGALERALRSNPIQDLSPLLEAFDAALALTLEGARRLGVGTSAPSEEAPPSPAIGPLLEELAQRIASHNPRAEESLDRLRAGLSASGLQPHLQAMAESLASYDFRGAAEALAHLRAGLALPEAAKEGSDA